MAPSGAKSRAKRLSSLQVQRQMRRIHYESENEASPLLKLPGEIRNHIYELAIPRETFFNVNGREDKFRLRGIELDQTYLYQTISTHESYERHFAITQVCRQLRQETLPLAYGNNVFLFRVGKGMDGVVLHPFGADAEVRRRRRTNKAPETWVLSRPKEALPHISRIILHLEDSDNWFGSPQITALLDLDAESSRLLDFVNGSGGCRCIDWNGVKASKNDCEWCEMKERMRWDFEHTVADSRAKERAKSTAKLLRLIQAFRESVKASTLYSE